MQRINTLYFITVFIRSKYNSMLYSYTVYLSIFEYNPWKCPILHTYDSHARVWPARLSTLNDAKQTIKSSLVRHVSYACAIESSCSCQIWVDQAGSEQQLRSMSMASWPARLRVSLVTGCDTRRFFVTWQLQLGWVSLEWDDKICSNFQVLTVGRSIIGLGLSRAVSHPPQTSPTQKFKQCSIYSYVS